MRRKYRCWSICRWQGRPRKVMVWANRNGLMYVLDRTTGQFLMGKPVVEVNWMSGFGDKGRPVPSHAGAGGSSRHKLVPSLLQSKDWTALRLLPGIWLEPPLWCDARARSTDRRKEMGVQER